MADLLIRNIDDALLARLKAKAERERKSLEDKIREALTVEAGQDKGSALRSAMDVRARIRLMPVDWSAEAAIREDRDSR